MMLPSEITEVYKFPFEAMDFQNDCLDASWDMKKFGFFLAPGTGKTFVSTAAALYRIYQEEAEKVIIICPPILVLQWVRWLEEVGDLNGGFSVTAYKGTPKQREKMSLDVDFLVMSIQIFKRDYPRLKAHLDTTTAVMIVDESHCIRNVGTKNYRAVRDSSRNHHLLLLTGTALNNPMHGYSIVKLLTPTVYRSIKQFKNIHVMEEDFFGQPTEYMNLDLLKENLELQSVFVDSSDVLDLPEIVYKPTVYELEPKHLRLYNKLVDEEILVTEAEVYDATQVNSAYHLFQKIVMNPAMFSDGAIKHPACYNLLDEITDELNGEKLIIFGHHQSTNLGVYEYLTSKGFDAVTSYGGNTPAVNQKNVDRFISEPSCQILIGNAKSAGEGLNLQMARYIMFLEVPLSSNMFTQTIARIHRKGQGRTCIVYICIADQTIQQSIARRVMDRDDVLQEVVPTKQNISKALRGRI